jgi:hypothetical protein
LQDTGSSYYANIANGGNGGAIDTSINSNLSGDFFGFDGNPDDGNQAEAGKGGAIANEAGATMTVTNSEFYYNTANGSGGAIENFGTLNVSGSQGCVFQTNTSELGNGGAIDSDALGAGKAGGLTVTNTTFQDNEAGTAGVGASGGAINTADNTVLNSDIFQALVNQLGNNAPTAGGAVNATGGANGSQTLRVVSCYFSGNTVTAVGSDGGAISTNAITDVETSVFYGNNTNKGATSGGGAIGWISVNANGAVQPLLTLNHDSFNNNSGGQGGAVWVDAVVTAGQTSVQMNNSTFYLNQALATKNNPGSGGGGGVDLTLSNAGPGAVSAILNDDTFFQNSSVFGGGGLSLDLTNKGTGTNTCTLTSLTIVKNTTTGEPGGGLAILGGTNIGVDNCILDNNTVNIFGYSGPEDVFLEFGASLNDIGYNLVDPSDAMFSDKNNDVLNATTGLAAGLAQNGAPANYPLTLALLTTSPGYNTGDGIRLAGTLDERGFVRQDSGVSIGAEDPNAQP